MEHSGAGPGPPTCGVSSSGGTGVGIRTQVRAPEESGSLWQLAEVGPVRVERWSIVAAEGRT